MSKKMVLALLLAVSLIAVAPAGELFVTGAQAGGLPKVLVGVLLLGVIASVVPLLLGLIGVAIVAAVHISRDGMKPADRIG
jgi:hypothetical protein